jgi:hypothetical protein
MKQKQFEREMKFEENFEQRMVCEKKTEKTGKVQVKTKGPHRPDAIRQRDANFQFSKTNKTVNGYKFYKICTPNS